MHLSVTSSNITCIDHVTFKIITYRSRAKLDKIGGGCSYLVDI